MCRLNDCFHFSGELYALKRLSVKMINRHSKIVFREIAFEQNYVTGILANSNFIISSETASQTSGAAHAQYQNRKQETKEKLIEFDVAFI